MFNCWGYPVCDILLGCLDTTLYVHPAHLCLRNYEDMCLTEKDDNEAYPLRCLLTAILRQRNLSQELARSQRLTRGHTEWFMSTLTSAVSKAG